MKTKKKRIVCLLIVMAYIVISMSVLAPVAYAESDNDSTLIFSDYMPESQVPNGINLEDPKYQVVRKAARYAHKQGDWQIDAVVDGDYATKIAYMCYAYTDETKVKYTDAYGNADCYDLLRVYSEKSVYDVDGDDGMYYFPATIRMGESGKFGEIYAIYLEGELLDEYVSERGNVRGESQDYTILWPFGSGRETEKAAKIPVYCAVDNWVYVDEMSDIPEEGSIIVEEGPFVSYAVNPAEYDDSGSWSAWMKIADLPDKIRNNPNGFDIETATSRYKTTVKTDWTPAYPTSGEYVAKPVYVSYAWVDDTHAYYSSDAYNNIHTHFSTKFRIYSEYPLNGGALANNEYTKATMEENGHQTYGMPILNDFPYALPKVIEPNTVLPGLGYIYLITEDKIGEVPVEKFEGAVGDNVSSKVSFFYSVLKEDGCPNTYNLYYLINTPTEWTYTAREVTASDTIEVEKGDFVRYRVKVNSTDWSDWCLESDLPDVVVSNPDKYTVETVSYRYKNTDGKFEYTNDVPDGEYENGPFARYISCEINYGAVLELKGAVVEPGKEFTLTLDLKNNMSIERIKIGAIDYDKNVFELVKAENGNMFSVMDDSDAPNCLWKNAKDATMGTVATYTFKVKDDAIVNDSMKYTFGLSLLSALDGKNEEVELNVENATVLLNSGVSNTGSILLNGSLVVIVGILCLALGAVGTLLVLTYRKKNVAVKTNNDSDEE